LWGSWWSEENKGNGHITDANGIGLVAMSPQLIDIGYQLRENDQKKLPVMSYFVGIDAY